MPCDPIDGSMTTPSTGVAWALPAASRIARAAAEDERGRRIGDIGGSSREGDGDAGVATLDPPDGLGARSVHGYTERVATAAGLGVPRELDRTPAGGSGAARR